MKKPFLLLSICLMVLTSFSQREVPIAVNDTVETLSQVTISISALLNDYDPDGDAIEIRNVASPEHGEKEYNDSIIFYTPDMYVGLDSLQYRIREVENASNISEYAWVYIIVNENPDVPVAVDDQKSVSKLVPTTLYLLENDTDPNVYDLLIYDIDKNGCCYDIAIAEDSLSVIFTSEYPLEYDEYEFNYSVIQKNSEFDFYSHWATVTVESIENPDIPTANADESTTTGGVPININILDNDINPSGGQLSIEITNYPDFGTAEVVNEHIVYTPDFSYHGSDYFNYKIFLVDDPYLYDKTNVILTVLSNPTRPVAVNDTTSGKSGEQIVVHALENDYDPDGAGIEIMEADNGYSYLIEVEVEENTILYSQVINKNMDVDQFIYRIRESSDTNAYSDWASVTINLEQNPDYPIAVKDYGSTIAGIPVVIDILQNDLLNGYNPIVEPNTSTEFGLLKTVDINKLSFTPYMSAPDTTIELTYSLRGNEWTFISFGEIEIEILSNNSYDSLDINNINAGVHSDGYLFSKYDEIVDVNITNHAQHFEYPKGSGNHTIFSNSMWIGGIDANDSLHMAAQRYKQTGYDFQFGPISDNYTDLDFIARYSRVWKLNKSDIGYHKNNYWKEGYVPISTISTWPGNGNITNGEVEQLAPYFDKNDNDLYEPLFGDYPLIRGDQCIFFIYNDDRIHTETEGGSLKVEIHGMVYGYDSPTDVLLHNTIFVHYDIYNRSAFTYSNVYIGLWTDTEIGFARDDYVGCNVSLSSYYGFNGSDVDLIYGEHPPAQSVTFLAGPLMDADNLDNPDGECDYNINGLYFGDGIVDNERLGMTRFIYHNNNNGNQGDPRIAYEYYNYLSGFWRDNTPVLYGGNGHESSGAVGPECRFMFPADSDPCNWGTNGEMPNGGYNENGKYWTEVEAGNNPNDRRGLGVTGPFTFKSGDIQEIEFAYSVGQGENGAFSSVEQLFSNLTNLFQRVKDGEIIVPNEFLTVEENGPTRGHLNLFPNPTSDNVSFSSSSEGILTYEIYSTNGILVQKGSANASTNVNLNIKGIPKGLYIIVVKCNDVVSNGKFLKL